MILIRLQKDSKTPFRVLSQFAECSINEVITVVSTAATEKNFEELLNLAYQAGFAAHATLFPREPSTKE